VEVHIKSNVISFEKLWVQAQNLVSCHVPFFSKATHPYILFSQKENDINTL